MHSLSEEYSEGTEVQTITVFKLAQAFEKILKKLHERNNKPQHVVVKYNYSMETQRTFLLEQVSNSGRMGFDILFGQSENRIHALFTFLSLLELIQQHYIRILAGEGRNNFIVEWNADRDDEDD